ncbi:MAG: hypothetical protein HQ592_18820 [Planctomycetes bacterium]|nr:hypothetical protein [Planctomycetota bacterium]
MIQTDGNRTLVRMQRLEAEFEGVSLVSLRNAAGRSLVKRKSESPGLAVRFGAREWLPIGTDAYARTSTVQAGARLVHVHVEDHNADACLRISVDDEGRLLVEPSAHSARRGLAAIRWNVAGIADDLKLVAPLFQGCRMALDHPLVADADHAWPMCWEAALAVMQGSDCGFSICAHDTASRPKSLRVGQPADAQTLGFDTEVHGPAHDGVAVGSLAWIVDTHEGDWQVPAEAYRSWWRRHIGHEELQRLRPERVGDIRLALQWAGNKPEVLDAVAAIIDPKSVVVHASAWRRDPYDVNYPDYIAGEEGAAFLQHGIDKGFLMMPHHNYFAIDPNHPAYRKLHEFVMREFGTGKLMGWRWKQGSVPIPQSWSGMKGMQDEKLMTYLHAGASTWRRLLVEQIARAAATHRLTAVFVDQTLCSFNLDNALVENLSSVEGMLALTRELSDLDGPLAIGGEGLNEMNVRYQSFAQAHLFNSHQKNCEHFTELDPVPVGDFLYGDLCKSMGYTNLAGDTPETAWRLEVHERLNALPSLVVRAPEDIQAPNPAVSRVLERALS